MSEQLIERGIVALPETIEHDTYIMMAEALLTRPDEPLTLYCTGNGGSIRDGLAIVDLIQAHKAGVTGMLPGGAVSVHGLIWAACAKRCVYPHGLLGVHKAGYAEFNRGLDTKSAQQLIVELEMYEQHLARILSAAGKCTPEWWLQTIQAAGSDGYAIFDAEMLLLMRMAEPVGAWGLEYKGDTRDQLIQHMAEHALKIGREAGR